MKKDEILAALPKLTIAELGAIQAVIGGLLGAPAKGGMPLAPVMLNALLRALGLAMAPQNLPASTLKKFNLRAAGLSQWLDENFIGWNSHTLTELSFLTMLFELVIKDLQKLKIKPTIGIVIANMIRIPKSVDNAFPGYVKSGMGSLILKPHMR